MDCTHDAPRPYRACIHLLSAEIPYVARYTGAGMECVWMCDACDKGTPELREVCEACRDRAKEGGWDRMVGTPGIVEQPSSLWFEHRARPPLAHPQLVDLAPLCGGDRDRWIGVTPEAELFELDLDRQTTRLIGRVPELVVREQPLELHVARTGGLAAVVQRTGRHGVIVDLATGAQTMRLDRSDYHEEHCAFSLAFLHHEGRDLVVHATEWNRLDISDARTGQLVTVRESPQYAQNERPPHYLDYFHCGLSVSPDQAWIVDNGWVWHPLGIVVAWRLDRWLTGNVWESEDGPTRFDLTWRDYFWDGPLAWAGNDRLCVWGYGESDPLLDAVQVHDLSTRTSRWFAGPRGELVFDRVLVALDAERGSTAWDLDSGARLMVDAHPAPMRFHPTAKTYLSFGEHGLVGSRMCGHHAALPWNTGVIAELAASIARDRTFDELPVLGDALEAAGCTDRELLDHCQSPGEHGAGCWALDRLRQK